MGKVVEYDGNRAWIELPFKRVRKGESVCVDGVCLTIAALRGRMAGFDIGPETARITTLGRLKAGGRVNLERALCIGDRLGGHWVTGHVEDTGRILRVERDGPNRWFTISLPPSLVPYVVGKGSLAVDGISLTVVSRKGRAVRLMIIPHTLSHTTLGLKREGDPVNLEADILAKYAKAWARKG